MGIFYIPYGFRGCPCREIQGVLGNYEDLVNRSELLLMKSLTSNWHVTKWTFVQQVKGVSITFAMIRVVVVSLSKVQFTEIVLNVYREIADALFIFHVPSDRVYHRI